MIAIMRRTTAGSADDIEMLLPWHATGRLTPAEARRVEQALAENPGLATAFAGIQEECSETVLQNESLAGPSPTAMQKLFAAIDAEPPRKAPLGFSGRIAEFVYQLSPRVLVLGGCAAAVVLALQSVAIGTLLIQRSNSVQIAASALDQDSEGAPVLVAFKPGVQMDDIASFLEKYDASIVPTRKAGQFHLRFASKSRMKERVAGLMARLRGERIVSFALASDETADRAVR